MELNNINNKGAWSEIAAALNQNFLKILAELLKYQHVTTISGANFLGYFTSSSVLPNPAEAAWAVAGDLKAVTVYAYYTSDAVPSGFSAGWNALSSLGTYDFTDYSNLLTKVEETGAKVSELGSKLYPITGVFLDVISGKGTINSTNTHTLIAGKKYIFRGKRKEASSYPVYLAVKNAETNASIKGITIAADTTEAFVEYTADSDVEVYYNYYTGDSNCVCECTIETISDIDALKGMVDNMWNDSTHVWHKNESNAWISYSTGALNLTSAEFNVYTIEAKFVKKVKVYVGHSDTNSAIIALYNSDQISKNSYIGGVQSYKTQGAWFEYDIPDDCKLIAFTNKYSVVQSPRLYTINGNILDIVAPNNSELTGAISSLICSPYIYTNSVNENSISYNYYLTENDNNSIIDCQLMGMVVKANSTGILKIYKTSNIGMEDMSDILLDEITIDKTGLQVIMFSTIITIAKGEVFGFNLGFSHAISSEYGLKGGVNIRYIHPTSGKLELATRDYTIGILGVRRVYDSVKIEDNTTRSIIGYWPFRNNRYYDHLFIDKINGENVIIPSESLFSIAVSKRLGFDVIEANVQMTSDGNYIVMHGSGGTFGLQVEHIDGTTDISSILFNSVTLEWIKTNVRYKSLYSKYRVAPPTLEEWLYECKAHSMIPLVQSVGDSIMITEKIMGKGNYIQYGGSRILSNNFIMHFSSKETKEDILNQCRSYGKPYMYSIANPSDFTDDELRDICESLHAEGFFFGYTGCYMREAYNQRLDAIGLDFSASGWSVPIFTDANICCLSNFTDFTHTGTLTDECLSLSVNDVLSLNISHDTSFLSVGLLSIRFKGSLTINMGEYIEDSFTHEDYKTVNLTTYYINSKPTFNITAKADTTITDIVFKASIR